MEFYHKVPVHLQYTLVNYSDFTRKVIYRSKLNHNVILAKACPTSKACEKFLVNSTLEFKIDLLPELINTLRSAKPGSGVGFYLIGEYENYKKDQIRLVMRDSEWGGFEILQQKKSQTLEDEDMEFEEDPQPIAMASLPAQDDKWEDMFGVFFIKKNDKIDEIVQVLNDFYVAAGFSSAIKKRKPSKKPPPAAAGKKPKTTNKEIIIEEDDENEEECEINKNAMIELCYFYENSGLPLYDCIMLYNNDINDELKDCFKYDFIPLLKNAEALYSVQLTLDEMIKKS